MHNDRGFYFIAPSIRFHHLVGFGKQKAPADPSRSDAASQYEAWVNLADENCRETDPYLDERLVIRVACPHSPDHIAGLAKRWNWSVTDVNEFLGHLEANGMLVRHATE